MHDVGGAGAEDHLLVVGRGIVLGGGDEAGAHVGEIGAHHQGGGDILARRQAARQDDGPLIEAADLVDQGERIDDPRVTAGPRRDQDQAVDAREDAKRALIEAAGVNRFVAIGTSLGGIVAMLLAGMMPGRIAGAVLNDIGPDIEPAGLARVRGYVGKSSNHPTWMHAARALQESSGSVYPDWGVEDWLAMAKRVYRLSSAGRIVLDYDARIAEPFRLPGNEAGPDMWRAFAALRDVPVLVVRGERSDMLSSATAERMLATLPGARLVTVPRVGHVPTLAEPEALGAIEQLLERVAEPA